ASFWCCHSLLPCGRRPDTGLGSVLLVLFGVVPAMIHRRRGVSGHWPLTVGLGGRLGGLLRLLGCRYGLLGGSDGVGAVLCVAALLDVVRFVTVIEGLDQFGQRHLQEDHLGSGRGLQGDPIVLDVDDGTDQTADGLHLVAALQALTEGHLLLLFLLRTPVHQQQSAESDDQHDENHRVHGRVRSRILRMRFRTILGDLSGAPNQRVEIGHDHSVPSGCGAAIPRCSNAVAEATLPRGVRSMNPSRTRKGSATVSTVSGSSPMATASVVSPAGPPPNLRHNASSTARSSRSRPRGSTSKTSRAAIAASRSSTPVPRTCAQSCTRRSSRLAILGVPRERAAIWAAASSCRSTPSSRAERLSTSSSSAAA